ncbi:MAG: hypothetical protein IGS50_06955 [Synechococcales cyanobacterium C42_A2020_086]|jgi:hypothetical protein|nr:hypothetical protein [Synechococcales cyanobacterium C42_A2020_086]
MTTQTAPLKPVRTLTTPQLLKAGLYVTWGASALMLISAIAGIQAQRNGLQAVTQRAIPNVIVAQRLKTAMTDIDSIVANQLLKDSLTVSSADQEDYMTRRGELAERIVLAARNLSLGDAEQKPLESILLNFNDYIAQAERARFAKERGDQVAMLTAYRQASRILDEKLLPAADEFAQVNETALERNYREAQTAAYWLRGAILLSGLSLLIALVALQFFLARRTRRTFNPALVAATAIAIVFIGHTLTLMSTSQTLRYLREDVYESIRLLRLGRVHLYQADGAKSRFLLDKVLSTQHETAFYQHINQVLTLPDATSLDAVIDAFQVEQTTLGMTGYLAESLYRATSPEERTALLVMMRDYAQYLQINQQIRQLALSGQQDAAIALSTGQRPGQSQWAFDQLLDNNEKAREIYVARFERGTSDTLQSLDGFEARAAISMAFVALLILLGLRPRLREYFI